MEESDRNFFFPNLHKILKCTAGPKAVFLNVPCSNQSLPWLQQPHHVLLYSEIIAFCSEIHTKNHMNLFCGENLELLNMKLG